MHKSEIATIALIVAAGRGSRISQACSDKTPKQYVKIAGKAVLHRTIEMFQRSPMVDKILVVIHEDDEAEYRAIHEFNPDKLLPPVRGGATRQESVFAGLKSLEDFEPDSKVLIHDAARPFATAQTIGNVIEAISEGMGALPALAVADTIKRVNAANHISEETVDRSGLYGAQTPQGFLLGEITDLHEKAANETKNGFAAYTDDASIYEAFEKKIRIVEGKSSNFKITTLEDLERAKAMVLANETQAAAKEYRTGTGYDVHAFCDGDAVILCGVKIPFSQKLKGHSDADVGLHALTDALLGTIGLGDIGTFFPPSDSKWAGADSSMFLIAACDKVSEKSGRICNMDVTLICEKPNIGPHRQDMIARIADICGIDRERVSVKATTNEKLGFLGRQEGIAAMASVSVEFPVNENVGREKGSQ